MAKTSHGHTIPGTPMGKFESLQTAVARCGGIGLCHVCITQASIYLKSMNESKPVLQKFELFGTNEYFRHPSIMCNRCGSAIIDEEIHVNWHLNLESML